MTVKLAVTLSLVIAMLLVGAPRALASLHPGDKIAILVYNHPELSLPSASIDADGEVTMPLAGGVDAKNLDAQRLARRIEAALAPYVRRPAVNVTVLSQVQSVFVSGGPGGIISYQPAEGLNAAVGGLQVGSAVDLRNVRLLRDGHQLGPFDVVQLAAAGQPGPTLQPGDTLELPNKPVAVTVRGEVAKPGIAYLEAGQSLAEAVTQVGGTVVGAAADDAVLERNGERKVVALGGGDVSEPAQNGDVLIVSPAVHVSVIGMVQTPGEVTLHQNYTLLAALYYAGGPTKYADLRSVSVVHAGVKSTYDITRLTHGDINQNPAVDDGDVVFVPEGHKIDFRLIFEALTAGRWIFGP